MALLTQQLQRRQQAYGLHQEVGCQGSNPYMPMEQVQYVDNPYLNTYSSGWMHNPYLSWNPPQPLQEKKLSLEEAMANLANAQAQMAKAHAQFMDETRQPP